MRGRYKTIQHHEEILLCLVMSGEIEIDSKGRIWRLMVRAGTRNGGTCFHKVKRRRAETQPNKPDGYLFMHAMFAGRTFRTTAQRVVWRHFKGPIPKGLTVNHKDGIKPRNHPDNLELATYSEQMKHAFRIGLKTQWGETNPASKLSDVQVEEIRRLYATGKVLQIELATQFGVRFQQISRIIRGERRPKQQGVTSRQDHRFPSPKDPITGRFKQKRGGLF